LYDGYLNELISNRNKKYKGIFKVWS